MSPSFPSAITYIIKNIDPICPINLKAELSFFFNILGHIKKSNIPEIIIRTLKNRIEIGWREDLLIDKHPSI
jgi:hypothetical protein